MIEACEALIGLQCAEHFADLYKVASPYLRRSIDQQVIDRLLDPEAAIYRWQH